MTALLPNPVLVRVALVIRDLLDVDESAIRIGRRGFDREPFDEDLIVVDSPGPTVRLSDLQSYDHVNEVMTYGDHQQWTVEISFYGPSAYDQAAKFRALSRSQAAMDLKHDQGITMYRPRQVTDVGALAGAQHGNRVDVEVVVDVTETSAIATRRIDTAKIEVHTEDTDKILSTED